MGRKRCITNCNIMCRRHRRERNRTVELTSTWLYREECLAVPYRTPLRRYLPMVISKVLLAIAGIRQETGSAIQETPPNQPAGRRPNIRCRPLAEQSSQAERIKASPGKLGAPCPRTATPFIYWETCRRRSGTTGSPSRRRSGAVSSTPADRSRMTRPLGRR